MEAAVLVAARDVEDALGGPNILSGGLMAKRRRVTGSKLLGEELRRRRGSRSLEVIARLSKSPPHADRIEPIAYSTLSMLERGVTMPSAQSLLTLSVIYHVPVQEFTDLIALERYHARQPASSDDPAELERQVLSDLRTGNYAEAYSRALACIDIVRNSSLPIDERERLDQLAGLRLLSGLALWKLGWLAQAGSTFRDVVDDLDAREELRGWAFQNLVEVERSLGRLATARAYARDGLELAERLGGERLQGTFHGTLANLESDMAERAGDDAANGAALARALKHHARAQALARKAGDLFLLANDLLNESGTRLQLGERAVAREKLLEGRALAKENRHARLHAYSQLEEGKLLLAEGAPGEARKALRRAEVECANVEANDLLFQTWFYLLVAAEELGDDTSEAFLRCQTLGGMQEGRFRELEIFEAKQARKEALR